ncbi:MAG TPA: hypothetical protein VGO80_18225 [Solirubrobacteraceae bacterium]|nr:hypothetical protein [Solirubrobacteraceae bacterium]
MLGLPALLLSSTFTMPRAVVALLLAGLAGQLLGRRAFGWLQVERHERAVLAALALTALVAVATSVAQGALAQSSLRGEARSEGFGRPRTGYPRCDHYRDAASARLARTQGRRLMTTRTIAIIALVIAVVVLVILLT